MVFFLFSPVRRSRAGLLFENFMRYDPFYHTGKWVRKRDKILRRDKYQCQIAKRQGVLVPANTVHHIFPRHRFPQYEWDDWNLISVSAAAHNMLENRATGELTEEGLALMEQTAKERGIKLHMTTLVIGLPGTGKTTYVKARLGADGICYDLDYIAAAFRLTDPKAERHDAARRMANDMLAGFAHNADLYSPFVFVIRTAPKITEVEAIEPDEIVILRTVREDRKLPRSMLDDLRERIEQVAEYARRKNIPLVEE